MFRPLPLPLSTSTSTLAKRKCNAIAARVAICGNNTHPHYDPHYDAHYDLHYACCWLMSIGIIHKFPSAATACLSRSRALALSPSPSLSFYACLFHCVCAELNEFREHADDGTMRSHRTRHSRITAKGERRNETNEIMKRTLRRRRRLAARWGEVKWSESPTKEIIKGRAQKGDAKTWQFLAWQHTTKSPSDAQSGDHHHQHQHGHHRDDRACAQSLCPFLHPTFPLPTLVLPSSQSDSCDRHCLHCLRTMLKISQELDRSKVNDTVKHFKNCYTFRGDIVKYSQFL